MQRPGTSDSGHPKDSRQPRIFYGWWLVLLAGLVLVVATVPLYQAMAVWALALERHFGWTRGQSGLALTIPRLVGLADPVFGYVVDRFGTRRTVLTGLCILAGGMVLFALTPNPLVYYAAILIMAVGSLLCGTIPLLVMLCRWFVRRRTTAIALLLVSTSLGGAILVPFIAWGVDPVGSRLGWRMVAVVVAGLTLTAALPVFALVRNRPEEMGLLPHGVPPAAQTVSFSVGGAFRTPAFWRIALGDGLTSMAAIGVTTYLGLLMSDRGFAPTSIALVNATYAGASAVFLLVGGYLGDRMPKRVALFVFASVQAAGILGLALANSPTMFFAFSLVSGAGFGGRGVLSIAILPDYFGTASLGKILGFSGLFAGIVLLFGAVLTGLMIDGLGGYAIPLMVLAGLNLLGALLFLNAHAPQLQDSGHGETAGP